MRYRNWMVVLFALFLSSIVPVTSLTGDPMSGTEGKHDPAGMGYRATPNVVTGFEENTVEVNVDGAAIHGGGRPSFPNRVTGNFGAAGGGEGNLAGDRATVSGGSFNQASGFRSSVGGGSNNIAQGEHSTVSGGSNNTASATRSTISGGCYNTASHLDATIGGHSGIVSNGEGAGGSNDGSAKENCYLRIRKSYATGAPCGPGSTTSPDRKGIGIKMKGG